MALYEIYKWMFTVKINIAAFIKHGFVGRASVLKLIKAMNL